MQGGECEIVFVSATASDPTAIAQRAEFILDLNRSNVAFSRVQEHLFVVCSASLLHSVPADIENYQSARLWKALRSLCDVQILETEVDEVAVRAYIPHPVHA